MEKDFQKWNRLQKKLDTRPVIILRKLSKDSFIVAPLTTKLKVGSWYVHIQFSNETRCINLAQIRTFDYRRMSDKYAEIENSVLKSIKDSLKKLLSL